MLGDTLSTDPSLSAQLVLLKALSNEHRLQIVSWLRDPTAHFPAQVDGDLETDGVCLGAIVRRLQLSQPTVTNHMKVLADAGLVQSQRIKNWHFFQLDAVRLNAALTTLAKQFG